MATMNISLPDKLKEWVEAQVAEGRHANVSDYVRDVLRREQNKNAERLWLDQEIEKGNRSGFHEDTVEGFFESAMQQAKPKAKRRNIA